MITKKLLETIAAYDEYHTADYEEWKDDLALVKKAKGQLFRFGRYLEFRALQSELGEREDDIYIVSHAKSGTTLTQMILYQMTTDGSMDFEHLYDVSPWPGWAISFGLEIKDTKNRRLLKSHDPYVYLNHVKKGKFIFLLRNPLDVLNSFFHHSQDYYQLDQSFEEWAPRRLELWYKYNEPWLKNEQGLDILYLNYEDTIQNKSQQINHIANFIGVKLTEEVKTRILERTSFAFMKQHEEKFGEQPDKEKIYNNFIRKGKAGEGLKRASEELLLKNKELGQGFYEDNIYTSRYYQEK